MCSTATVFVQNIAAATDVTDAIPAILKSARTFSNKDTSFFLLRPFNSDHLGTIHTINVNNPHKTILIIMPEVKMTSDDALLKLPNIYWAENNVNIEYCPVRIEYGWGSGKAEVNTFLEKQKQKQTQTQTHNETKTSNTTIVPVSKGICCVMYEEISSKTHSKGSFRLILNKPTKRTVPWKNNNSILCEHIYTENYITTVSDLSNGQTHVGAVCFHVGEHSMIFGCHLTFQGGGHPDQAGSLIRKQQIEAIKEKARFFLRSSKKQEEISYRCYIAGDINLRPVSPAGKDPTECRSMVDSVLSLTIQSKEEAVLPSCIAKTNDKMTTSSSPKLDEIASAKTTNTDADESDVTIIKTNPLSSYSSSWSNTAEWTSTPFCSNRRAALHPPTYPIKNHSLWEHFLSNGEKKNIFDSPITLFKAHEDYYKKNQQEVCSVCENVRWENQCSQCQHIKDTVSLYDSYKKNRFTPSSWTDGMLIFDDL